MKLIVCTNFMYVGRLVNSPKGRGGKVVVDIKKILNHEDAKTLSHTKTS